MTKPRIYVQAQSLYIEDQSFPEQDRYAFSYVILIKNLESYAVQLLRRYWLITDANGKKIEVNGEGVVGEQPIIQPNSHYQYTSGALLETPIGTMQGYYEMQSPTGILLNVTIPVFRLAIHKLIH